MSVQPPGYNPSDSLLQGGSATITPLMGGGGFIEGTPDQSLLQGGNSANIVPLKGGRRIQNKRRSRKQKQRGGADNSPTYTAMAQVVPEIPNIDDLEKKILEARDAAMASAPVTVTEPNASNDTQKAEQDTLYTPRDPEMNVLEKKILEARDAAMASAPVTVIEPEPVKAPLEPTVTNIVKKAQEDAIASGPLYTPPDVLTPVKEEPLPIVPALSENEVKNLAEDITKTLEPVTSPENLEKKMLEAREAAMASAPVTVFKPEPVEPPPEPTLANTVKKARDDAITAMRVEKAKENIAAFSPQKKAAYATVAEIVPGLPKLMSGGGDDQEIKIEKAALDQIMLGESKLSPITEFQFKEYIQKYKKFILPKWKRFNILNKTETEISKLYTSNFCPEFKSTQDDTKSIGGLNCDRLVYIIPQSINRILLLPPVNGSTTTFLRCLNFLNKKNTPDNPNLVVIFAPPFFGNDIEKNKQIYAHFLKNKLEQEEKGAKIFLLSYDTLKNISIGCKLMPDDYILNMLEPSYIVLPYKRTIENQEVGGIIFSGASADEEAIPISRDDRNACISNFLIFSLRNNWFAFPPRTKMNDSKLSKYKVYRFIGDNKTDELNNSTRLYFRLTTEDKGAKKEAEILGNFYPTHPSELLLNDIDYELIQLGGETYSIRKPILNKTSTLTDDWVEGKFTEDEAKMLNDLNFKPEYLKEIFVNEGENWRTALADFLLDLVLYKCYSDTKLLTGAKCDQANDFINRVFEYFLENDTRIAGMHKQETEIYIDTAIEYAKRADKLRSQTVKSKDTLLDQLEEYTDIRPENIPNLAKNPFNDGKLVVADESMEVTPQIMFDSRRKEYAKVIYAKDIGDKMYKAIVYVKTDNEEQVYNLIQQKIQTIKDQYPGWVFIDTMQKLK